MRRFIAHSREAFFGAEQHASTTTNMLATLMSLASHPWHSGDALISAEQDASTPSGNPDSAWVHDLAYLDNGSMLLPDAE